MGSYFEIEISGCDKEERRRTRRRRCVGIPTCDSSKDWHTNPVTTHYAQRSSRGRHTDRNGCELMGSDDREVGVASALEDLKVDVGGSGVKEGKVG
jgi:hypothetical protein